MQTAIYITLRNPNSPQHLTSFMVGVYDTGVRGLTVIIAADRKARALLHSLGSYVVQKWHSAHVREGDWQADHSLGQVLRSSG